MTQLDRIEQKLDRLLVILEAVSVENEKDMHKLHISGATDSQKATGIPPRELRKWPEITHRGPKVPGQSR